MVCFLCGQTLTVDLAEEILEVEFSIKTAFFFPLRDECQCSQIGKDWLWRDMIQYYKIIGMHFRYLVGTGGQVLVRRLATKGRKTCDSMALTGHALLTRNPAHNQLQAHNKRDIHGVVRTACANCTECPQVDLGGNWKDFTEDFLVQFISIPGHVLCAYCGCPPARHGKGNNVWFLIILNQSSWNEYDHKNW